MRAVVVIPARMEAERFPGKPLERETGKYLLHHVWEQVRRARGVEQVIIATDSREIEAACRTFGAACVLTSPAHRSGTDRVAEAARELDHDLVVNVQGDEPEMAPRTIERLLALMAADPEAPMGTCAVAFPDDQDPAAPDVVKVVLDGRGRALYFSRAPIPHPRDGNRARPVLKHLGIYAYRPAFLQTFAGLAPMPLEETERLEQLRALEHGHAIAVAVVEDDATGIDTPEDYARFVARERARRRGEEVAR